MELITGNESENGSTVVPSPTLRYDGTTLVLHWVTAILVVLLWAVAQVIDFFPKGSPRIAARSTHMLIGVILGVILLMRVVWRSSAGRRLPRAAPGLLGTAATVIHYALYALVVLTVAVGVFNAWVRGDHFFGLFTLPKFAPNTPGLKAGIENLHSTLANTLLIVAGVHAVAALIHHFVLRDGVLQRMLPGKRTD